MKRTALGAAGVALTCLLGAAVTGPASTSPDDATSRAATPSIRTPTVTPAQLVFQQNIYTGVSALSSDDVWAVATRPRAASGRR